MSIEDKEVNMVNLYKATVKTKYLEFKLILIAENRNEAKTIISEKILEIEEVDNDMFKIVQIEQIPFEKGVVSCNVYDNEDI